MCVCLCVSNFSGKALTFQTGTGRLQIIQEKKNIGIVLKPFGSKVMIIFITHSYVSQL